MSNVVHKTKKQGTSLGHIYSPFLTRVLSVSVCLRHPFENENGDTQWESAGLVDKCAGAMEKRKSALYTTAGTGWLTFLLMPSHEPCHFSEDMDRCLPVLTPLWPHRKLHVSLCFQVMARVRMFLGPIYGRIPPPYMSYVESFEWSASAGDSAEETRHSTQRTVYARTSRGRSKHHVTELLCVAFYGFKWISDTTSCVCPCRLQPTFCSVFDLRGIPMR